MPEEHTTFRVVYHINMNGIDRDMPGGLRVSADEVYIIFPTRDLNLKTSDILSQRQMGDQIAFEFEHLGRREFISFTCEDNNEALLISKLLPNPTPYQEQRTEVQAFYDKLDPDPKKSPVTTAIIAINVIVFLSMILFAEVELLQPKNIQAYLDWGANRINLTVEEPWRLFTCAFLHFGLLHIACNMYFLHMLGRLVERLYGRIFYIIMYVFSAFIGSLASLIWNENAVASAGASGAVFGVVGMLCAYLIIRKKEIPKHIFDSLKKNMFMVILMNLAFGASVPGIDNAAHIGGLIGGCLAGLMLTRSLTPKKRQAQFLKKLLLSLSVLPLIILVFWKSGIIQNKPIRWYSSAEDLIAKNGKNMITAMYTLVDQKKQGQIDDSQFINKLKPIFSYWEKVHELLKKCQLKQNDPISGKVSSTQTYVKLRMDEINLRLNLSLTREEREGQLKIIFEEMANVLENN
jgi:membrane associated rhomboid family serine protease